jgi:hypothetical protein
MMKIMQIAVMQVTAGQPPSDGRIFCLLEDGSLAKYDVFSDTWEAIPMPPDYDTRQVGVVSDTRMPKELELIHNAQTQMWSWRNKETNETGEVFDSKKDAINDAKQRLVVQSVETPTPEHLPL